MNPAIPLEPVQGLLLHLTEKISAIPDDALFAATPPILPAAERQKQLEAGQYLLVPNGSVLRAETAKELLDSVLDVVHEYLPERRAPITQLREFMQSRPEIVPEFFAKALANDTRYLVELGRRLDQEPDVILFLSIYLLRSYRRHLAGVLLDQIDAKNWWRGYCPVCGHWPGLAFLHAGSGQRDLWCVACTTTWRFKRIQCPFCLNENQAQLHYLSVEEEDLQQLRLYLCDSCRRYLKCVAVNEAASFTAMEKDAAYLTTAYLDYLATEKGYLQEPVSSVRYEPETVSHYRISE
jgi:FdhE protein